MNIFSNALRSRFLAAAVPIALVGAIAIFAGVQRGAAEDAVKIPAPAVDEPAGSGLETAVLAGGCFWGVQGVFEHVKGVESAVAGYAGGTVANPSYEQVGMENTGHAESVKITFDPKQISYGKILQIFFSVVQDPTELNYQGPDHGTSYRSAVFTTSDAQKKVAAAYVAQLDAAKVFPAKIVTEVTPYTNFYQAEDYHQDNAITLHVNAGYIQAFDLPKIANLKTVFPEAWQEKPQVVFAADAV
ncbi:MAG: peptide-methionine (S)-S-oxide reductase MsrA [Bauldia sp.]